eukprot:361381-Chlamydomonas_euryale.AAC.7
MSDAARKLLAVVGVADQKAKAEQYKVLLGGLLSTADGAGLSAFIDHSKQADRLGSQGGDANMDEDAHGALRHGSRARGSRMAGVVLCSCGCLHAT